MRGIYQEFKPPLLHLWCDHDNCARALFHHSSQNLCTRHQKQGSFHCLSSSCVFIGFVSSSKARLSTSLNGATQNNPYLQCLCYGPEEKGNTMKTHSLALWRASVSGTPDTQPLNCISDKMCFKATSRIRLHKDYGEEKELEREESLGLKWLLLLLTSTTMAHVDSCPLSLTHMHTLFSL